MKSIELHNFKKFEFLPEIKLGKVNFLVGKNNSGKSSFIRTFQIIDKIFKECKLVTEFEDPESVPKDRDECFALGPAWVFPLYHEETRMATFKNYLYDKAKDDTISINLNLSKKIFDKYYDVNVVVKFEKFSMHKDRSWGKLTFLNIKDDYSGIEIEIDLKQDKETFVYRPSDMDRKLQQIQLSEQIVEKTITMSFDSLLNEINNSYYFVIEKVEEKYGLSALIKSIYSYITYGFTFDDEKKEIKLQDEIFCAQSESMSKLERKLNSFCNRIEKNVINPIYIPTSVIRAKNQYDICDKNDVFASIISQYVQSRQAAYEFIKIWMKKFEIGETFRIDLQESQYYRIYVKDKDGVEKNLSELGTGSVRLMALLLQIGTILKTEDIYNDPYYQEEIKHLVLIEEPEQNLHPALQSKLADFFESVPNTQFIVETHSEYIIRRSQVLVAKKGYKSIEETNEKSPFVVYYFPDSKDLIPYKMQYQPSGRFLLDFGEGFFDAAANISIELAKIERENRKK